MGLLKPNVRNLGAVGGVLAQRRSPEPSWVVDQEQDELERIREADEVELGTSRERHGLPARARGGT
jgi:hypothetical protein